MIRICRQFIFISAFILFLSGCDRTGMTPGQKLPDFFFYDLNGNKVRIYDHLNHKKTLLLHFWGAACCLTYSAQTLKAVSLISKSHEFDDVEVISINLDYPDSKVKKIADELAVTHLMLIDRDSSYYKNEPELKFFFPLALILAVDENGIVRGKLKGPQLTPSIKEVLLSAGSKKGEGK